MEKKHIITIINRLLADVRQLRMEADKLGVWVTPLASDCLAFAVTEIAEAVDATLRDNPVYTRNSKKEVSVADELGDTAIMLASYLIAAGHGSRIVEKAATSPVPSKSTLAAVAEMIAQAWVDSTRENPDWVGRHTVEALCTLVTYMDNHGIPIADTFNSRIGQLGKRWVINVRATEAEQPEYPTEMRLLMCPACSLLFLPGREMCSLCQQRLVESDVYQPALFRPVVHDLSEFDSGGRLGCSRCDAAECDGEA